MTRESDPIPGGLAFVYSLGRLIFIVGIAVGVLMILTDSVRLSAVILRSSISVLTLLPAFGLILIGVSWIRRSRADWLGWLALCGATFLIGAWILI
jgi:hypothetical protein